MKRWRAPRDLIVFVCLIGAIVGLGLALAAATRVAADLQGPIEEWAVTIRTFGWALAAIVSVIGAGVLVWLAVQYMALVYALDRNAIYIAQPGSRYTIPLDQVVAIAPGEQPQQTTKQTIVFGRGQPRQQLLVETEQYMYRLALAERNHFGRELQERRQLGVVQILPEGQTWTRPALHQFFAAAATRRLLIVGVLLNLALWAFLTWRFPTLPTTVPVRFDPLGGTAGTRAKTSTLLLPVIATGVWLVNLVLGLLEHRRSRLVAELLLLGSVVVQIVLLLAVWFIATVAE
ncbi:MAG TPA: hypothetical protein VFZ66_28790 [Herpetosiphonaceae bacterium]